MTEAVAQNPGLDLEHWENKNTQLGCYYIWKIQLASGVTLIFKICGLAGHDGTMFLVTYFRGDIMMQYIVGFYLVFSACGI